MQSGRQKQTQDGLGLGIARSTQFKNYYGTFMAV
jgi:hypothetical protein